MVVFFLNFFIFLIFTVISDFEVTDSAPQARVAARPSLWVVRVAARLDHLGIMEEISLLSKLPILISSIIPGVLNCYILRNGNSV